MLVCMLVNNGQIMLFLCYGKTARVCIAIWLNYGSPSLRGKAGCRGCRPCQSTRGPRSNPSSKIPRKDGEPKLYTKIYVLLFSVVIYFYRSYRLLGLLY